MQPEEEKQSNNLIIWIFVISILLLILIVYMIFIKNNSNSQSLSNTNKISNSIVSNNSYMFASPIRALSGGDLIRITVFVLDNLGNGLNNEKVNLISDDILEVKTIQELTDENGKAVFDIGSDTPGQFVIKAEVGGLPIEQTLKVNFD